MPDDVAVYDGLSATEVADRAAEAIRGLNHLTSDAGSLRYRSDVYRALGSLTVMAGRLPPALTQMSRLLEDWVDAGDVTVDSGEFVGDPVAAVTAAGVYLDEAAVAAATLTAALTRARAALAHCAYRDDDQCDVEVQRADARRAEAEIMAERDGD